MFWFYSAYYSTYSSKFKVLTDITQVCWFSLLLLILTFVKMEIFSIILNTHTQTQWTLLEAVLRLFWSLQKKSYNEKLGLGTAFFKKSFQKCVHCTRTTPQFDTYFASLKGLIILLSINNKYLNIMNVIGQN